jgi:hypothetical protein
VTCSHDGEYEEDSLLGYCAVWSPEVARHFRGLSCLYHQGDEWLIAVMMKAVSASETSVTFYETTEKPPRRQSSSTVIYFKFQPASHLSIAETYTLKTALLIYLRIAGLSSGLAVTCTGSSMHLSWFVVNVIDIQTLPAPSHSSL